MFGASRVLERGEQVVSALCAGTSLQIIAIKDLAIDPVGGPDPRPNRNTAADAGGEARHSENRLACSAIRRPLGNLAVAMQILDPDSVESSQEELPHDDEG